MNKLRTFGWLALSFGWPTALFADEAVDRAKGATANDVWKAIWVQFGAVVFWGSALLIVVLLIQKFAKKKPVDRVKETPRDPGSASPTQDE